MADENLQELKGKNWMAAMALCWLFGMIGAHRFYTGKDTTAWVMVVLTILGLAPVTAIWAFVDGCTLAAGSFTHNDGSELYERVPWFGWLYVILCLSSILIFVLFSGIVFSMVMAAISSVGNMPVTTP